MSLLKKILVWLGFLGVASAATLTVSTLPSDRAPGEQASPDAGLYARYEPYSRGPTPAPAPLCMSSATTTKCTENLYDIAYLEPKLVGQKVCLAIHDSDGAGFTYITANNGALVVEATGCK